MSDLRIGSLFSGYGGLDLGVQTALGGTVAWHCDYDAGPSKVLAHHWPDVPNLHDVTDVDWASVEPVDVITGGSPCQDVSAAGKRAGMRAGTRSGLWASMCDAIDIIRPGLVVWENVRGAYSAAADSDVEPCPFCVGDGDRVHLRALGRVLGDLAEIGYDAWWTGLRAADAGAPHSRFRVFVFAWPAGADSPVLGRRTARGDDGLRSKGLVPGGPEARGSAVQDPHLAARRQWRISAPGQAQGGWPRADAGGRGGAPVADSDGSGLLKHGGPVAASPEHSTSKHSGDAAADTCGSGLRPDITDVPARQPHLDGSPPAIEWGPYGTAIHRWEEATAREAPAPTELGRTGQPRLSPTFVEWLMGLPAGHVTTVPGLSRNEQLKLLGNGVVPQQASLATRQFLAARPWEMAA